MQLPNMEEINRARALVYGVMPATPQYSWPLLNQRLGTEAWIKHENYSPVGAFKLRGALVYVSWLKETIPTLKTVVAATRGNHGQGVALAAKMMGLRAIIVVPHGNSREKNLAMRALGAELIEHGDDFQESLEFAAGLSTEPGCAMVESLHQRLVMGTATYAVEFLEAAPALSRVYVPVGLGSSICGMAAARNALGAEHKNGQIEIIGVVSSASPSYALSFRQYRVVEAPSATKIADGLACRVPNTDAMASIWEHVSRFVEVSDEEVKAAMRAYFEDTHNVAEGAAGAALAGAMQERASLSVKTIGIVLTGGNVDREVYLKVLQGDI